MWPLQKYPIFVIQSHRKQINKSLWFILKILRANRHGKSARNESWLSLHVVQFQLSVWQGYCIVMSDRPEDFLSCGVCFEEHQESGSRVPRILPCPHTLCENCLISLLGSGSVLKCPECRVIHVAPSRERTFPQNKYLLTVIRLRDAESSESKEDSHEVKIFFKNIYAPKTHITRSNTSSWWSFFVWCSAQSVS